MLATVTNTWLAVEAISLWLCKLLVGMVNTVCVCVWSSACDQVCDRVRVIKCVWSSACDRVCMIECVWSSVCDQVCVIECVWSSVCDQVCAQCRCVHFTSHVTTWSTQSHCHHTHYHGTLCFKMCSSFNTTCSHTYWNYTPGRQVQGCFFSPLLLSC